jgi:glucose-6-phosphate 1-dehydrogenase
MSERAASPTILVVFGATGDLMARKIVPSIFHLHGQGLLPDRFRVVGFARRDWTDDQLREHVRGILAERYPDADRDVVESFLGLFVIQRGTFDDEAAYEALSAANAGVDAGWGACANKLFYLAVPPENYETIFRQLAASGLTRECSDELGWTRVLVEKPFGKDVATSNSLDELLSSLFREEQIYRIDHYLAKEMLEGIIAFRFHNDLFEGEWDRRAIDRIDITLDETLGVESRGAFYDGVGALRDVGQNHLLQMLALVTMDKPATLDAASIRASRAALLRQLKPLRRDEIERGSFRAQYEGYRSIKGVAADSETETYFKFEAVMAGPRWAGVPVTFESGKRVGTTPMKRIVVSFRHLHPCLCPEGGVHYRNEVVFTLEPDDSITISFWAKKPGFDDVMEERTFDFFLYRKTEKLQYVEEYSRLLYDAIRGDQTAFVSTEEVRAMWTFTDPIVEAWRDGAVPLESYAPDTDEVRARADMTLAGRREAPQIGVTGLGKMGAGIARNLLDHGWQVVGHNRHPERAREMAAEGLIAADTLRDLVACLRPPRAVWLMVPAGVAVDATLFGDAQHEGLADLLEPGDTVIDGGNSYYKDAQARAARLSERGIRFLDCGTSGGPAGARNGACLMIGGDRQSFEGLEQLFADIAVQDGYAFFDGVGSGHFVKMVHNGIEYGMMQSIAEGFAVVSASGRGLDLARVADIYQHGSVVESRLVGWLETAYGRYGEDLEPFSGSVGRTGEGEWTVAAAAELGIEAPAISGALRFRVASESEPSYAGRVLQALRNEFGGHGLGPGGGE